MTDLPALGASAPGPALVPVFLGQLGGTPAQVCDGRTLHAFLQNGDLFANWIKARVEKYGFVQDQDFAIALESTKAKRGGRNRTDYHLSLDMAKELCMVENNAKGREARRYFIAMERQALAATAVPFPTAPAPAPVQPRPSQVEPRLTEAEARDVLIFGWWTRYRGQPVRIRDLLGTVRSHTLATLCRADTLEGQAAALGRLLRTWSGRTVGGFRVFEWASVDHQGPQWRLQPAPAGRSEPAPLPPPLDPLQLPGVCRAINRRAHLLSRDHFEQHRKAIEAWLRRRWQFEAPATVIARIAGLQLADLTETGPGVPRADAAAARSAPPAGGRFSYAGAPSSALPFACDGNLWSVPPAKTYTDAQARGEEYARHLSMYLQDNREFAGGNLLFFILRAIAASGGLADEGSGKGYAAGFCSGIERWAVAG